MPKKASITGYGTFCFSRPVYTDGSSVPRWLEFGVLKANETLWVEVFEN